MKKFLSLASPLFIFLAGFTLSFSEEEVADLTAMEKLYQMKCASCHAKDGKGKPAMAKILKLDKPDLLDLSRPESIKKTKEEWVAIITKGQKKMPAFGKKLKAEEIDGLADYVRSLVSPK